MLPMEHSAILLTFIKLPFVLKIFVLSIFSGRLRQVLVYIIQCNDNKQTFDKSDRTSKDIFLVC